MGLARVDRRGRVLIPQEDRMRAGLRPGVEVEITLDKEGLFLRPLLSTTKDPLSILIGKKPYPRHVPVRELEEKLESR